MAMETKGVRPERDATSTAYALPHLLQASAARRPEHTAIEDGKRSLSYRELDRLSDRLAATLTEQGVERGDRVGFFLNKSLEAVVAIFGIMKAGAAYVPLDPNSPARRVAYILQDCRMKGVITDGTRFGKLEPELGSPTMLRFAILTTTTSVEPRQDLSIVPWDAAVAERDAGVTLAGPIESDLAYILYTSGSTGDPKGVMVSHRAALTFANWSGDTVRVTPEDRLSQHAPLHFDLSTFDLFASLRAGATTVLVPPALSVFPRSLADFIATKAITVWYSVPSILTSLLNDGGLSRHDYGGLRAIIFAGEVFPTKYLRGLMAALPNAEYHNWYGPTETNVCTAYPVRSIPDDTSEPIPIGRACENTEVFAVTADGKLAGVDEEGELYVRGPSLMEGYWGLDKRSAQALVPHPLNSESTRRVYRTGDLVRLGEDGDYRFLGRRDNMIKLRGYRIELGEIEAALYGHQDVAEAATFAVPDGDDGTAIKAAIVTRAGTDLDADTLQRHCAGIVPKYMVPTVFEFYDELPKTSTGKVDRPLLTRLHLEATATPLQ